MDDIVDSKVTHVRTSFNPTGELVPWRGFRVASSSQEVLELLVVRFPQILDRLHVRGASFQTLLLDRLANFVLEMHSFSLHSLRAEDLDRLSCEVDDLSLVGFDMSPFRSRLDLLASSYRTAALRSEVTSRHHEYDLLSGKLTNVQHAMTKLKTKLQEYESIAQDLEGMILAIVKARDTAIANLEALAMPSLQFDMSWPLDHSLL